MRFTALNLSLALLSGCATSQPKAVRPVPPVPTMPSKTFQRPDKGQGDGFIGPPTPAIFRLTWNGCPGQLPDAEGVRYRIYLTRDLGTHVLFAETASSFLDIACDGPSGVPHLFTVRAMDASGQESAPGTKGCE